MENNGDPPATMAYSKEKAGVGLGCQRVASDRGVFHQREPLCFRVLDDYYRTSAASPTLGDKESVIEGGGKQELKQEILESGILLVSRVKMLTRDVQSVWNLEYTGVFDGSEGSLS